jgi:hypothetical protein
MDKISRRNFIRKLIAAAGFYSLANLRHLAEPGLLPVAAANLPDVSVAKGTKIDSVDAILQTALVGLGGIERFVRPGQTVAIKPNATWAFPPHTASSTDPDMLRALIRRVQSAGASRIIIMDHCAIDPGSAESLRVSGIGAVVDEMGVEGIFPDRKRGAKDIFTEIELPHGQEYKKLSVIKAAVEADVRINMAVAKSHNVTKLTLCMKHMMGFMAEPQLLHAWLYKGISDLNTPSQVQAQLHILEAIRVRVPFEDYVVCAGPETDETDPRVVKRCNQVIAGVDPVLIDAYACINYYSMRPRELAYLNVAAQAGVGDINVEKATEEGRLGVYSVGEIKPTSSPTVTLTNLPPTTTTSANPNIPTLTPTIICTQTPLPTAPPSSLAVSPAVGSTVPDQGSREIIDAGGVLNYALIPASLLAVGAGMLLMKKANQSTDHQELAEDPGGEPDSES